MVSVKVEFQEIVRTAIKRNGYPSQQALCTTIGISRDTLSRFLRGGSINYLNAEEICRALNLDLMEITDFRQPVIEQPRCRVDWGEAPDSLSSFSREEELKTLEEWIIQDHCRFVLIKGMKGMGKNNLSSRLGKLLESHFDFCIWRSLDQYVSITELIDDLYRFFTERHDINSAEISLAKKYELLKNYLSENKCLIILANIHILYENNYQFNSEKIDYEKLLTWITEKQELSCIILTTSIELSDVSLRISQNNLARCFQVKGLSVDQMKSLFSNLGIFSGSDQDWQDLGVFYSGNLFALQNIALDIRNNFAGNISSYLSFIKENHPVFNDTEEFLDREFDKLSNMERDVMYWLSIYHHPLNIFELKDIVGNLSGDQLLMTINNLKLRFFVEGEGMIAQPPMIRSFFAKQLIDKVNQEIIDSSPDFLARYPLLITHTKARVRKDQNKIFLQSIIAKLKSYWGFSQAQEKLESILKLPKNRLAGYTAGNIINLLRQLEYYHFEDQVFSDLMIKNADFRGIYLQNVDFSGSELSNCLFQDGFSNVLSVAFSPNGKYLAIGDNHAQVYLWRLKENQPRPILHHIINSDNYWVRALAFSPDNQLLASGGDDNYVYLREVEEGRLVKRFDGHIERIRSLSFSPDGKYLASSGDDWTIRIWDIENLILVTVLNQHQDKVRNVIFSGDGKLISASQDNLICVWQRQIDSFTLVNRFFMSETKELLRTVALSPDGKTITTGNDDNIIRLWTLEGKFIKPFLGHNRWLRSLAFSPDGSQLASASEDQTIRLWDVRTGQCLHILKDHKARIWSIAYHPHGSFLVAGDDNRKIKLWQKETGECLGRFEGYSQKIGPLAFHPNGQALATQSIIDKEITNSFNLLPLPVDNWNILSLTYDPTGQFLVAGSDDSYVKIWDCFAPESSPKSLLGHHNWIRTVAVSANGQLIASGSDDKTVKLWDSRSYRCLHTFTGHTDWIRSICFDPKGQFLASSSDDGTIKLWDIKQPYELKTILRHNPQKVSGRDPQVWAIAISPDGEILATGSNDNSISIWHLKWLDGDQPLTPLNLHEHRKWIAALAFSPDGKWLASASYDTTIRLWELASGHYQCREILQGHAKAVTAIAFHPSEPILVSSSKDGSIKQWDLNSFSCVATGQSLRPYEQMNITGVKGLNKAQKQCLKHLGAVEQRLNH